MGHWAAVGQLRSSDDRAPSSGIGWEAKFTNDRFRHHSAGYSDRIM